MNNTKVYPWHDLAWDLALADGMDEADIDRRLAEQSRTRDQRDIPEKDGEGLNPWWTEAASIEEAAKTEIAEKLFGDIYAGKLPVRKANGDPLDGEPGQFKMTGPETPHLTVEEGNDWLKNNRYLQVWEPGNHASQTAVLAGAEGVPKRAPELTEPAVAAKEKEPRTAETRPKFSMTRAALIAAHEHAWPTIKGDIKEASKNGLSAAMAGKRGWCEDRALAWARAKGKLEAAAKPADPLTEGIARMASLPSAIHKIQG